MKCDEFDWISRKGQSRRNFRKNDGRITLIRWNQNVLIFLSKAERSFFQTFKQILINEGLPSVYKYTIQTSLQQLKEKIKRKTQNITSQFQGLRPHAKTKCKSFAERSDKDFLFIFAFGFLSRTLFTASSKSFL